MSKQWRPPPVEGDFQKDFALLKLHTGKKIETMISEAFKEYTLAAFEKVIANSEVEEK